MGIKDKKNCILWGFTEKAIYRVDFLKKKRAWTVCRFKRGLGKNGGGVFEGGWYPNACYGKLNHRLTGFILGVKLQKIVMICKCYMEGSQEM